MGELAVARGVMVMGESRLWGRGGRSGVWYAGLEERVSCGYEE